MNLRTVLIDAILKPLEVMEAKIEQPTNHDEIKSDTVQPAISDNKQNTQVVPETPVRGVDDRSSYNCTNCFGEGLTVNGLLCPVCKGTGKV